VCQRCGIWHNFVNLTWQQDWRGNTLQNTRLLVCRECLDVPQNQLQAIVLSADSLPVPFSVVEPFVYDETTGPTTPYGAPVGLEQYGTSPQSGKTHYGVKIPVLSILANGTQTIAVTCSAPHGLATNGQIAVEGLSVRGATGFYSVVATSATAFTYATFANVVAGQLVTPTTLMWTVNVGLPYSQTTIPQVAPP
jgi:hypothetical protein